MIREIGGMENSALISRRVVAAHHGMVLLEEKWNTADPNCPFVFVRFDGIPPTRPNPYQHRIVLAKEEFDEFKPELK